MKWKFSRMKADDTRCMCRTCGKECVVAAHFSLDANGCLDADANGCGRVLLDVKPVKVYKIERRGGMIMRTAPHKDEAREFALDEPNIVVVDSQIGYMKHRCIDKR